MLQNNEVTKNDCPCGLCRTGVKYTYEIPDTHTETNRAPLEYYKMGVSLD